MKLFMEINPQLFDDCSHEYTEQQNSASAREAMRERKWAAITEQASKRKLSTNGVGGADQANPGRAHATSLSRVDEVDTAEDNQKRLDSLKLQDGRQQQQQQQRPAHERQNSVGSSRSQQR